MNQDEKKIKVAEAALEHIESGQIVGIGSGTTVHALIDKIDKVKNKIDAVVSSSELTTQMLEAKNIRVIQLKESGKIPLYIDGADESNQKKQLIKGGGGALTREKIIANASKNFVCMIDDSKYVKTLGKFPLPIEVIKMSQSIVATMLWDIFITSIGNGNLPSVFTYLLSSIIHTKFLLAFAIIFSLVNAPPPPFISCFF